MLFKQMDNKEKDLKWTRNIYAFYKSNTDNGDTFVYPEDLRSERDDIYHIVSENGPENWNFEVYQNIFPNQKKENMVILKDCSHFLHEEKPKEIRKYVLRMLEHIDATDAAIQPSETNEFEIKHVG